MQYFSYLGYTLTLKNNLEKAIVEFLKENDRKVINESNLSGFKKYIVDGIELLNQKFNKCKPRRVSWWEPKKGDCALSGVEFTNFILYKSK